MSVKNATELVVLVENLLGWSPPDPTIPLWRARQVEAGKIRKLIKRDPKITLAGLEAAVHFLHHRRKSVSSPVAVSYYVEDAIRVAADDPAMPISDRIDAAIAREREGGLPDSDQWIGLLARVAPHLQISVLEKWENERSPLWPK